MQVTQRCGLDVYRTDDGKIWHQNRMVCVHQPRASSPQGTNSVPANEQRNMAEPVLWGDKTFEEEERPEEEADTQRPEPEASPEPVENQQEPAVNAEPEMYEEEPEEWGTPPREISSRPKRKTKMPDGYGDYV